MVELDLKSDAGRAAAIELITHADMLVEGFRPGVMERLGFGPDAMRAANPRLIYGRVTGWGQDGPFAQMAGHDINYIAVTGALDSIRGRDGIPITPINLLGDYAGGSLYLLLGMLSALYERERSGQGQVVDAAIVDGVASLLTSTHSFKARGQWSQPAGHNLLDGGAFFHRAYECVDGKWIALGASEPQFFATFRQLGEIHDAIFDHQRDPAYWPELGERLAAIIRQRTRAEWMARFEGSDACVTPVMSLDEARDHPHMQARGAFVTLDGYDQPAPAPKLSRTPLAPRADVSTAPIDAMDVLTRWRR